MGIEINNVQLEFLPVRQLLLTTNRSRCVDAFALSLLKTERQARRLFTYLAFQFSCFDSSHVGELRAALASHRSFGFFSALAGIDMISPIETSELIGPKFADLFDELIKIRAIRNKLFHGQVTTQGHSRDDLENWIAAMMLWTETLAASAEKNLGYDGFSFNSSYTKHYDSAFHATLKAGLTCIHDYVALIDSADDASSKHIRAR